MSVPTFSDDDRHFMRVALSLSKRGLGNVWPNPAVGCVIVAPSGHIVGRGNTRPGGRPHAERVALDEAGPHAAGATAYVTLEPCSHFGKTPPCAKGLIEAGVRRVVSAMEDPDVRVSGRGHQMLRDAGIIVDVGLGHDEARTINSGFLSRIENGRPVVTLKLASTMDGRSAMRSGESQWITGQKARAAGHLMRARHDAILVGADTVLADNPDLRCREPGCEKFSPVRIVLDRQGKVSPDAKIAQTADIVPTWIVSTSENEARLKDKFSGSSVKIISAQCKNDHFDLNDVMNVLAEQGLTRVMVESGGKLAAAFVRDDLVDQIVHFIAPTVMGSDGKAMIGETGFEKLADIARFRRVKQTKLGQDICIMYCKEKD